MNIVFMGTPDFAVESLSRIYDCGHCILTVVSQPDRPVGRGMHLKYTPVKEYALGKGLPVLQVEKVKNNIEFIEQIRSLKPDVIVVVAFGQILPKELLDIPKYGSINVHGSLLPKYRGAAPIQWSIINGEEYAGVTTMYMDAGMDTGDMILKEKIKIEDGDNFGTLYEKLKKLGGKLIIDTLEKVADGRAPREKQGQDFCMAPIITKEMCLIDWSKPANDIRNFIRGLNPIPGAYTHIGNQIMKVWWAEVVNDMEHNELPGTILKATCRDGLYVATGDGVLNLTEIQMQNAKRLNTLDYLRGNKIDLGVVLN